MWNGDSSTEAGRSDLFPADKAGGHPRSWHGMLALHVTADFFEELGFACNIQTEKDVFRPQEISQAIQSGLFRHATISP
jgi:hypothetical protein